MDEEKYEMLELPRFVRERPDTYVGAIAQSASLQWIVGSKDVLEKLLAEHSDAPDIKRMQRMQRILPSSHEVAAAQVVLQYSPAGEKIVDEILQNALDRQYKDSLMKNIKVDIDHVNGVVSVYNDGAGMKVTKPDTPGAPDEYWPTILCTRVMAGGNFTKTSAAHFQSGRNGIGLKAAVILSTSFEIRVADPSNGLYFTQTWRNGMTETDGPTVKKLTTKTGYVQIVFKPDMEYLGQTGPGFSMPFTALLHSRVWELAAVADGHINISLNGSKIPIKGISKFSTLFGGNRPIRSTVSIGERVVWDVSILPASGLVPADTYAFVNGLRCSKGKHVSYLQSKLVSIVEDVVRKRSKSDVTISQIKQSYFAILAVWIDGPRFKSQCKDSLDTPVSEWGFTWTPDDAFCKRVVSALSDIVTDNIAIKDNADAIKESNKSTGGRRSVNIPKYEPAGTAGVPGTDAILILTEGDSAKGLAMAGRAVMDTDMVGVFCLKGKPPNARSLSMKKIVNNVVLSNTAKILGLEYGKVFETEADLRKLRYKHVVLLADQDYDGGHIVGLVCNWIEHCWPSLLRMRPDFIRRFATPIIIAAAKGSRAVTSSKYFLSLPSFKKWLEEDELRWKSYVFTYYKGLGGHLSGQGREYFSEYSNYSVTIEYVPERDHVVLDRFFNDKHTDDRKSMLLHDFNEDDSVDYSCQSVTMEDFLMKETLAFSNDDVLRSIVGLDGLKRTQRKLMWAVRNVTQPGRMFKVTDLAMQCAKESKYHHGEASLYKTMVAMAQVHPGTNNINVFACGGQMGTRHSPRDKYTDPRYLKTGQEEILQYIFRKEDDPILTYRVEDGSAVVEPTHFVPIIPFDVINGSNGVGTGWKSSVPAYNPIDIVTACTECAMGVDGWETRANACLPWYDGITCPIVDKSPTEWMAIALYSVKSVSPTCTHVTISDLPSGVWVEKYYKKVLNTVLIGEKDGFVSRIESNTTDARIRYTLVCDTIGIAPYLATKTEQLPMDTRGFPISADASIVRQTQEVYSEMPFRYPLLEARLRLTDSIPKNHMNRLNANGRVELFPDLSSLIRVYSTVRLDAYAARIEQQVFDINRSICQMENRLRFITEITGKTMTASDYASVRQWWSDLSKRGYVSEGDARIKARARKLVSDLPIMEKPESKMVDGGDSEDECEDGDCDSTYEYLTNMRISACTQNAMRKIEKSIMLKQEELKVVLASNPVETWVNELQEFKVKYGEFMERKRSANAILKMHTGKAKVTGKKRVAAKAKNGVKKRAKSSSSE
jgi:DNA topoisomerase-2